jgi:5'-nucleotidase
LKPRRLFVILVAFVLVAAGCSDSKTASPASNSSAPSSSSASDDLQILVSNDDGVGAPGLDALVQALVKRPGVKVTVVAPADNSSGTGGQTSPDPTGSPAKTASGYDAIAVKGFPADAVNYGLTKVFTPANPPDLVMAGINAGQNLGPSTDLSGTVGAARAGANAGVVSIAISAGFPEPPDYVSAVAAAMKWLDDHEDDLRTSPLPPISVFVLNTPTCTTGRIKGTLEVAPDFNASLADAIAPADCSSTDPPTSTDVPSFHVGFATLAEVTIEPVAK